MFFMKTIKPNEESKSENCSIGNFNFRSRLLKDFMRRIICLAVSALAILTFPLHAQTVSGSKTPFTLISDEEIRQILIDRIDVQKKSVGMVVGIIDTHGRRIISYGHLTQGDNRPLNGQTIFEIGSFTKIFTALLLSDMVQRGELDLTDPLEKYLPSGSKVPERNGKKITLVDLATHTSGLPFQPPDMTIGDPIATANYTVEQAYKFLSSYTLDYDIGTKWAYSNLDYGMLGIALVNRAGMNYETLVKTRITDPLGMKSTSTIVSTEMKLNLSVGHNAKLEPAIYWSMPAFQGASSLLSSTDDILTFLSSFLGLTESPLKRAMEAMLKTHRPGPNFEQSLGWWVIPFGQDDEGIITFAGATFGFTVTVAYDPKLKTGVVVFSNSTENDGGLAWHLLRPAFPVETSTAMKAINERKEIAVDTKLLDKYTGKYKPNTGDVITIERRGNAIYFISPTAPYGLHLFAESEQKFFIKEADFQVTFQTDSAGNATGITVRFGGIEDTAQRVDMQNGR